MQKYIDWLEQNGADMALEISTDSIETAAWTLHKCKYGCSSYGTNRCCPPHTPNWKETQEIIDEFERAILFKTSDFHQVTPIAVNATKELFFDDYYKAIAFGSGPCHRCLECPIDYCNFATETIPSMEACGIDVFGTLKNNGIDLHTLRDRGEEGNYFGLILVE